MAVKARVVYNLVANPAAAGGIPGYPMFFVLLAAAGSVVALIWKRKWFSSK
jgi:hypothetical protein